MSRTVVDIDDKLLKEAQKLTGIKTKVELVNAGLKQLVRQRKVEGIKKFRGKLHWEGDLREMRKSRIDTCG